MVVERCNQSDVLRSFCTARGWTLAEKEGGYAKRVCAGSTTSTDLLENDIITLATPSDLEMFLAGHFTRRLHSGP
jgi:hypothetical protein